jgi:hypothetical protein
MSNICELFRGDCSILKWIFMQDVVKLAYTPVFSDHLLILLFVKQFCMRIK